MENIEDIIGLLPAARQQAVRRQLAKIAEENPHQHLLLELTLAKLGELQRKAEENAVKSGQPAPSVESGTAGTVAEVLKLKKEIIGEVGSLRKELSPLARMEEDTRHTRIRTDKIETKLDLVRPYRAKIALVVISLVLAGGCIAGWFGHIVYENHRYEQTEGR